MAHVFALTALEALGLSRASFHADGGQRPVTVTERSDRNPPPVRPAANWSGLARVGGKSGPGKARLNRHASKQAQMAAVGVRLKATPSGAASSALRSQAASTFGMISSFSRLRSSSVLETGTSANGGQMSSRFSPASFSRLRLSVT